MKILGPQLSYFFANRRTRTNIRKLVIFFAVLAAVFVTYSLLFQYVMMYEGREEFSWLTGFYWTLVTMTTLGYGDVVFYTDLGRLFSILVIFSGVLFLLVMLPFTFIEFFYAPWMKALNQSRAPRELPRDTRDHVIITHLTAVTEALVHKLKSYGVDYAIVEPDLQKALDYSDRGYKVVHGPSDDPGTYEKMRVQFASMVVASGADTINTNITFTVREYSSTVPIVASVNSRDSIDILKMAGANHIVQLGEMLGRSLARRTMGGNARIHVIGHIDQLVIGEATVKGTPLIGKTIKDSQIREKVGVNIVGLWERGEFKQPLPETEITERTVLVLAGTVEQLRKYDEVLSIYHVSDDPVVIIGAGRVGRATARSLEERMINYRIIDKDPNRIRDPETYVLGDAADLKVLEEAGIRNAHTALVTTHDDDVNIYLTIYCRRLSPDMQIISRATFERNINTLHRAGADFVMSYASMGANSIFNILEKQDVVLIAEGLSAFNRNVKETLAGKTLKESDIRQRTGASVIAIRDGDQLDINPDPERVLKQGEELILIGQFEGENLYNEIYESSL